MVSSCWLFLSDYCKCVSFLFGKVTFGTRCNISVLLYWRHLFFMQSGVLMQQEAKLICVYLYIGFETRPCLSREWNGNNIKYGSDKSNVRDWRRRPRGLIRRKAAFRMPGLLVRIPPRSYLSVERVVCCIGRLLWVGTVPCPGESSRECVCVCVYVCVIVYD
jgi:hypothetical protein